ncbi:MAG: S-layer homology domain-containing protein [Clostridia bacterium]|nr:S-layer homology domain-containing protein [Clostridia bacterium]
MKLNKKLISFGLLISMLLMSVTAGAAITGVTVTNGGVDRAFDPGRTLYNVYVPAGQAPEFTAVGGTITTEVAGGVATVTDTETGIKYRFIINEFTAGDFEITGFSVSALGEVTLALTTPDDLNVMVTNPKALHSQEAYSLSEITGENQESKILGQFVIPAGTTTYTYQIPSDALSGTYKFIFAADSQYKSKVDERNIYFTRPEELDSIRDAFNAAKGLEDVTENNVTIPGINSIVAANYFAFNIDLAKYNALADKSLFVSYLVGKNFTDNQVVLDEAAKAYALSMVNASSEANLMQTVTDFNLVIGFDFAGEYTEVKDKANFTKLVAGKKYATVNELLTTFDSYIALARVNEADPATMQTIYDNYKTELAIPQTTVNMYNLLGTSYQQEALKGAIKLTGYETIEEFNAALLNSITVQYAAQEAAYGTTPGGAGGYTGGGGGGSTGSTTTNKDGYDFGTNIENTNHAKEPDYEKPTLEEVQAVFSDLDNHEWAHEAIMLLYDWGVINGKGEGIFDPDGAVTREEFVKMLMLAIAVNDEAGVLPFTDVTENDWFYKTVSYAYKAGITKGITETEFGVGTAITRQDMAVMLDKAMSAASISVSVTGAVTFTDSDQIADYAKSAVEALANRSLLKGSGDGSFEPNATVTRAVAAQAIYNIIKNV